MINKHLDKIEFTDLEQLRSNAVLEGKTIEYKKLLPTNSDSDRKEFLADTSSFSNASGGDLIFDLIWNACGFKRSHNFDEAGNWTAK